MQTRKRKSSLVSADINEDLNFEAFMNELQLLKISSGLDNAKMDKFLDIASAIGSSNLQPNLPSSFSSIERELFKTIHCKEISIGPVKVKNQEYSPRMFLLPARKIIMETLEELFVENNHSVRGYFSSQHDGVRFGSIRSGTWFHEATLSAQKTHNSKNTGVLGLILYTDGTAVGMFGKHSMKPIYMAFANCDSYRSSIRCIGFFADLECN